MNKKKTLVISIIILGLAALVVAIIFMTEPTAKRESATRETAMLVNVVSVERGNFSPVIKTTGTVQPVREIILSPRVSGEVVRRAEVFNPGEAVESGRFLLQIDEADYRIAVELRKSDLEEARANLIVEKGRQAVARRDFEQSEADLSEESKALVLRKPQLQTAEAAVRAAESALNQAQLDLQRTSVLAPFDALILSRNIDAGSQVSQADVLGRLVGTEEYWIIATVPQSRLAWLSFTEDQETNQGAKVLISNPNAWGANKHREGVLQKMTGELEGKTRMVKVLVSVPDPLGIENSSEGKPALLIGAFVELEIDGKEIEDVVRLNRDYLRNNNTVWVMEDEKLAIKNVEVVLTDAEHAYIKNGLQDGDQVVTTNLATVVEDSPLRVEAE